MSTGIEALDILAEQFARLPGIGRKSAQRLALALLEYSDEDIAMLAAFLNENKGRYRYAEIMPYHTLGIGKSEKIGANVSYVHDSADDAEITRWCSLFASHGVDVRIST